MHGDRDGRCVAAEPGEGGWRRGGRGFWHLSRLKRMTAEQMDYVPRILGLAILDRHPAIYLTQSTNAHSLR